MEWTNRQKKKRMGEMTYYSGPSNAYDMKRVIALQAKLDQDFAELVERQKKQKPSEKEELEAKKQDLLHIKNKILQGENVVLNEEQAQLLRMSKNLDEAMFQDLFQRDSFMMAELNQKGINLEATRSLTDIVSQVEEADEKA